MKRPSVKSFFFFLSNCVFQYTVTKVVQAEERQNHIYFFDILHKLCFTTADFPSALAILQVWCSTIVMLLVVMPSTLIRQGRPASKLGPRLPLQSSS